MAYIKRLIFLVAYKSHNIDVGKTGVFLESAKLKNMQDFLVVPSTHTHIMNSNRVIKAVQRFLEEGKF